MMSESQSSVPKTNSSGKLSPRPGRSSRSCSIPVSLNADRLPSSPMGSRRSFDAMSAQSEEDRLADGRLLVLKVIGKINLRIERREYDDLKSIVNQIPGDVLVLILNKLSIDRLYQDIPSSLCVVAAIFSKIHTDCKDHFPVALLRGDDFIHHLVRYFSELLKFNDQTFASARSREYIRTIFVICLQSDEGVRERLLQRVEQFSNVLEGFAEHTLVEIVSRSASKYCLKLHEALKVEMERALAHYKVALHRFNEVLQKVPHQNIDVAPANAEAAANKDELEERTAEYMRLLTHKTIEDRLFFNQSVLNAVDKGAKGQMSVSMLSGKLESRVRHDKEVLQIMNQLKKEFRAVKEDDTVIPLLERFHRAYGLVYQLLMESDKGAYYQPSAEDRIGERGLPPRPKYETISISLGEGTDDGIDDGSDTDIFETITQLGDDDDLDGISSALSSTDSEAGGNLSPKNRRKSRIRKLSRARVRASLDEMARMRKELESKNKELKQAQDTIQQMNDKEKEMKERLADQAQRQLQKGGKFENLSEGDNRPTKLVEAYDNLYTQTRVEALDGLEELEVLDSLEDSGNIKAKLLFSAVVVAFRTVSRALADKCHKVKKLLDIPDTERRSKQAQEINEQITTYLRSSATHFNINTIKRDVSAQLWKTLYDFPELQVCLKLQLFIEECVDVAWKMSVQTPPMVIDYESTVYCNNKHTRFYTSDMEAEDIKYHVWPALVDADTGHVYYKGVIVT